MLPRCCTSRIASSPSTLPPSSVATLNRSACLPMASEKAVWKFTKEPRLHRLTIECGAVVITLPRKRKGRPKKGEPAPTKTVWRLRTKSIEIDDDAVERARTRARFFVLITDHLDPERWPDTRVLTEYRHQHMVEGHTGYAEPGEMLSAPSAAAE